MSATTDPIVAIHAVACWEREKPMPARLWRSLSERWLHRLDRRVADDVRWLEHDGVLEDVRRASGR